MWIAVLGSVNLEAALKGVFNGVLAELWLGVNNIGDDGAKVIVEALKVNALRGGDHPLLRWQQQNGRCREKSGARCGDGPEWIRVGAVENDCASTVKIMKLCVGSV